MTKIRILHPSSSTARGTSALTRARARRRADGAVIFVTAMTMAVLASLGLYALSATRTEVRASGYMSRTSLVEGLELWGLNAAMNNLTTGAAALISAAEGAGTTSWNASTTNVALHGCQALANVQSYAPQQTKACLVQPMSTYLSGPNGPAPPVLWAPAGRTINATVDLFTEMTNVDQPLAQPKGFGLTTTAFRMVTLTSYGILRAAAVNGGQVSTEVVHQGRGHLIVGPIQVNGNTTS